MKSAKRRRIQIDGVYDIECEDWTKFVCGGYLKADGSYYLYSEHMSATRNQGAQEMADCALSNGGYLWAHYGGKYDHKWLIDIAARRGYFCQLVAAGPRIISAQIGHLRLRDSFALVPVSLKELTEGLGVHKEKLDLPCICDEECGGYCSISRYMKQAHYNRLCEYLRADCFSLKEALDSLQDFADENDIDLCATVGSSAWRTMQRWLGLEDANLNAADHAFARGGYYGGRCFNARPGTSYQVHEYDVTNMYGWSMSNFEMPTGISTNLFGDGALAAFVAQKPGIYNVSIDIPEAHFPPLPYRLATRIAYPWGRFNGTWTLPEIIYAIELGAKIIEVHRAIVWSHQDIKLAPYVKTITDLRQKAGKNTPMGIELKFMTNAPTGKFGSSPDKDRFFVNPTYLRKCDGRGTCPQAGVRDCGKCCEKHCNHRCGAMAEHSEYIWSEYKYHLDACAHIEWAAYLTSNARIEHHRQIVSVNEGLDVVIGDTDSCYSLEPRDRRIGSSVGLWEPKGICTELHAIAPKCYWYVRDGKINAKAKGLNAPKDKPIEVGKEYKARGVVGLRKGATIGRLFSKKIEGRRASYGTGDRILVSDGITRAPHISEVEGLLL